MWTFESSVLTFKLFFLFQSLCYISKVFNYSKYTIWISQLYPQGYGETDFLGTEIIWHN